MNQMYLIMYLYFELKYKHKYTKKTIIAKPKQKAKSVCAQAEC